jgi:hypothetical protein
LTTAHDKQISCKVLISSTSLRRRVYLSQNLGAGRISHKLLSRSSYLHSEIFFFNGNFKFLFQKNRQSPVVDVIVVLIALPSLTILALLLEANTRGDWFSELPSRLTVFGLGLTLAIVCLAICVYVTTRLGGKMWSGAIPVEDGARSHLSYYVSKSPANTA